MRPPRARARERDKGDGVAGATAGAARARSVQHALPRPAAARRSTGAAKLGRRCRWATSTRTLFYLNVFALAVVLQNAGSLLLGRWWGQGRARWARARAAPPPLAAHARAEQRIHAGYVERRPGAFRGGGGGGGRGGGGGPRDAFDAVLGLAMPGCGRQWARFAAQMGAVGPVRRVRVASARAVLLAAPPVPLAPALRAALATATRPARARLRRRVAYFAAHRAAWAAVVRAAHPRALVIDEGLLLAPPAAARVGRAADAADEASVARRAPWHVVLLRSVRVPSVPRAAVWAPAGDHAPKVVRADGAAGAGAYVVSLAGARLLLERAREYRGSVDEEFAKIARDDPDGFVLLDVCTGKHSGALCPGLASDITVDEVKEKVQCIWRRLEEQRLVVQRSEGE